MSAVGAALAALVLAAAPVPFGESPPVEVWVSEDWPAADLAAAAKLPGASLGVVLRSNMPRPELVRLLQRRGGLLRLAPGLAAAHIEELRKLSHVTLVVQLSAPLEPSFAAALGRLGPHPLRIAVSRLDEATARSLAPLKDAEVEVDLRGRVPDQEELAHLRGLSRARRAVRLRAEDPPALVAAALAARPVRLAVELGAGALPEAMLVALVEAGLPVRLGIDERSGPEQLKAAAALPNLALEMAPLRSPQALPGARALLEALVAGR